MADDSVYVDGNASIAKFDLSLGRLIPIVVIPLDLCYSLGSRMSSCHPKSA